MNTVLVGVALAFVSREISGVSPSTPANCNLQYLGGCHQYRAVGSHEVSCPNDLKLTFCHQECNSANCQMYCQVPGYCKQNCAGGHCGIMRCESKNSSQQCTRSACEMECNGKLCQQECRLSGCNMTCSANADKCVQTCHSGNCNMRCPSGVRKCEQNCMRGICAMTCNAEQCDRSCEKGKCIYNPQRIGSPHALTIVEDCNVTFLGNSSRTACRQDCNEGNCALVYSNTRHPAAIQVCEGGQCSFACTAPLQCRQICIGGRCDDFRCNSEKCLQECVGGNCRLQCSAKTCFQLCRGAGCIMNCPSEVDFCYQWCAGGSCQLTCSARRCHPFCETGNCVTSNVRPQIATLTYTVRCAFSTGFCQHKCYQRRSCICRRYYKFAQSCKQLCDEGSCRRMTCYMPGSCNQICVEGECKKMMCRSKDCIQECQGSNCIMDCRSTNCTQLCPGGSCEMKCSSNTDICIQSCNSAAGACQHECRAKRCHIVML